MYHSYALSEWCPEALSVWHTASDILGINLFFKNSFQSFFFWLKKFNYFLIMCFLHIRRCSQWFSLEQDEIFPLLGMIWFPRPKYEAEAWLSDIVVQSHQKLPKHNHFVNLMDWKGGMELYLWNKHISKHLKFNFDTLCRSQTCVYDDF